MVEPNKKLRKRNKEKIKTMEQRKLEKNKGKYWFNKE